MATVLRRGGAALLAGLALLVPLAAQAPAASAQAAGGEGAAVVPKPVIGVLDVSLVMSKSQAAQGLSAQRERFVESYQKEVAETEKELRQIDQDLARQRATLAPEVFAERRQAFQERVNVFQQQGQARRRNLEKAYGAAMNTIQATVIRATKEIAEARGMNLVLYRSQTFLFDSAVDITDRVLAEVDQRLPAVTMQDPETLVDTGADGASGDTVKGR